MGPKRGWEDDKLPGARTKNLKSFKKVIKSLLETTMRQYRCQMFYYIKCAAGIQSKLSENCYCFLFRNSIVFLQITKNTDRKENLASLIRELISKHEEDGYVSVASDSDNDD